MCEILPLLFKVRWLFHPLQWTCTQQKLLWVKPLVTLCGWIQWTVFSTYLTATTSFWKHSFLLTLRMPQNRCSLFLCSHSFSVFSANSLSFSFQRPSSSGLYLDSGIWAQSWYIILCGMISCTLMNLNRHLPLTIPNLPTCLHVSSDVTGIIKSNQILTI